MKFNIELKLLTTIATYCPMGSPPHYAFEHERADHDGYHTTNATHNIVVCERGITESSMSFQINKTISSI